MRERKIKIGGIMRNFADLRTLKLQELQHANETRDIDELRWRYKSDGDVEFFEAGQEGDNDIIFGGDKSALRRIEDIERNISILANKVVTASDTNSFVDTDANFGSLFDDDTRLKGNVNFYNANVTFSGSTGSVDFNGLRLQGVGSPVNNSDAATKYFVTSYVASELQAFGPHYTDADARNAISVSGDLSYNASTGVISYTGGVSTDLGELADVGGSDTAATGDTILYDGTTWNYVTLEDEINTRITAASSNTALTGLNDVGFTNDTVADGDFLLYDSSNSKFGYVNFNSEASSIADARIAVTNSNHVSFGSSISATAFEGKLYDTNGNVIMDNTSGNVGIGGKIASFNEFQGDLHGEIIHPTTGSKVLDMQFSTPIYTGNMIGVLEGVIYDPNGHPVLDNGSISGTPNFGGNVTGDINSNGSSTFSGNVNFTGATITGIDLLPSQTNNAGYFLKTDGTNVSWAAVPAGYTNADADARIANASITDLSDVDATSQANNLALVYNSTTQEYVHGNLPSDYGSITDTATQGQDIATNHVGSGSTVSNLTDLGISDGTSGQVLTTDGNGSFTFSTITQGSNYGDANVAAYLNTNLDTAIIPDTNSVYDLGSAEYKFRDLYLSSNSIHLGEALITSTESGVVDLGKQMNLSGTTLDFDRKPEVLTINTHAPEAGQDIDWFWHWEASLLYSRESIFNIVQEDITLYRRGTYTFVNFATMQMGEMTQAHGGFIKKIDGAGQQNNLDGTSVTVENRLNPFTGQVQEATVTTWVIPDDFTASNLTLTQPSGIAYNVRHAPGAYEFWAGDGRMHGPADGTNPSIGPLYRGSTYTFHIDAAGHPFYFTTDDGTNHGANAYVGEYTSGVTGSRTDVGQITFTVPNDAPDTLFYQCGLHQVMRGQITIRDLEVPESVDPITGEVTTTLVFQHGQEGMKSNLLIKDPVPVPDTACIMFDGEKFTVDDMKSYYQRSASFRDFLINDIANSGFIKGDDNGTISATGNITTTKVTATSYIVGDKELTPTDNSIAIDGVELTLGTSMERITLNQPGELQLTSGTHRWYAETNITVDKIVVRVDIAPEDGDVGVVLNKTGTNTGLNLTIADGENKKTITPTNLTLTEDDYFTVDVTSVGSTAKGSGLTVTIHYYKS